MRSNDNAVRALLSINLFTLSASTQWHFENAHIYLDACLRTPYYLKTLLLRKQRWSTSDTQTHSQTQETQLQLTLSLYVCIKTSTYEKSTKFLFLLLILTLTIKLAGWGCRWCGSQRMWQKHQRVSPSPQRQPHQWWPHQRWRIRRHGSVAASCRSAPPPTGSPNRSEWRARTSNSLQMK